MLQDFAFLKLVEKYRRQYGECPLPVLVCDRSFLVYWSNARAGEALRGMQSPSLAQELFAVQRPDEIWAEIKRSGSCVLHGNSPVFDGRAVLTPVLNEQELLAGAVVMLLGKRQDATTIAQLVGNHIREGVGDIFRVLDDMAMKAQLMQSGWIHGKLDSISTSSYRLLRAAANLSEYSSLAEGERAFTSRAFDLAEWVEEVADTVCEIGRTADIAVEFSACERFCPVQIDRALFELAFFNLLHNSLYFTRAGNAVRIVVTKERDRVCVELNDRGVGIPPDQLQRIWSPYTTYTHHGRGAGMGLGLAVVRQVAQLQHADVELQSALGEGTVATLYLPPVSISNPLALRQDAGEKYRNDRFSRLYVGLADVVDSPYQDHR